MPNFATLNVRGLKKIVHNDDSLSVDMTSLLQDLNKHDIDVLAVQESHLPEYEYMQKEPGYQSYFVNDKGNIHHGTGILIKSHFNPSFKRISGRVCTASFKVNNNKHYLFISGYAPHESLSNQFPDMRKAFYNDLQLALLQKTSHTIVIFGLDANAKTNFNPELDTKNVLGQFTKGYLTNKNGEKLLQFSSENDLYLTNTRFQHKMSRRTTWTAPYRSLKMPNGETRRNPIRNQIDYILINQKYLQFVLNSRSYNQLSTSTDHNIVIMNLDLKLSKLNKPKKDLTPKTNIELFKKQEYIKKYLQEEVINLRNAPDKQTPVNPDEKWSKMVDTCKEAGVNVLGVREKHKKPPIDKEIKAMTEEKQRLHNKLKGCNTQKVRKKMQNESKKLKKKIYYIYCIVCLFVCLFVCVCVCLFVCPL